MRRREGHSPRRLSARVPLSRHGAHRAPRWVGERWTSGTNALVRHALATSRAPRAYPAAQDKRAGGSVRAPERRRQLVPERVQLSTLSCGPRSSEPKTMVVGRARCSACSQSRSGFRRWIDGAAGWARGFRTSCRGTSMSIPQSINAERGVRCVGSVGRAQIADGVNGRRADASESTRRAECAAPCLSLHVKCLAGGLAFCVAAQGHAARRRLSERYKERDAGHG